ncbi:DUF1289 domain-containing protein [Maritimibacter sp. UBA3975]|uniref:DUF1289 domain-containing protein n=1 Tax=Maritimibacter sp. UBA3975 TaxID=1946833 RepID=UPI000C0BB155|nr:DUF1289 domain-containing protein [Maritimibacter sp. UBA3975]MAM61135.1 DUF1289 domain-containing protein [Maritimibacter sp.]
MTDDVWMRDEPLSPCNKICQIHPEMRICIGCYRTIQEIAGWSRMSDMERREVMEVLPERAPMLAKRKGGRARRQGS